VYLDAKFAFIPEETVMQVWKALAKHVSTPTQVGKVPAKHVSIPTLKSVYDSEEVKLKDIELYTLTPNLPLYQKR
jgi:hypothetical protein